MSSLIRSNESILKCKSNWNEAIISTRFDMTNIALVINYVLKIKFDAILAKGNCEGKPRN